MMHGSLQIKHCSLPILLLASLIFLRTASASDPHVWPATSVIYTIYPSIFSPQRGFEGVTAQLGRLKDLGVNVIWLMPVTPVGQRTNNHPAFNSPYCVHDYYAVNPEYGGEHDLNVLVDTAHRLGLKVILDEVLNHTSWDNPLIRQHPEFYVHSDNNSNNTASIETAFNFSDVAQLNYANPQLRAYMAQMLTYWIKKYDVDGFRFDCADDPDGPERMIPADFWLQLGQKLVAVKPDLLLLGECETPDLAAKPFMLEYGWRMYDALKSVSIGGDAEQLQNTWDFQTTALPQGVKLMLIQDDWDLPRDINTFGGAAGAETAAIFNFTNTGVPLIYDGMEIGNSAEAVNPHSPINWSSGNTNLTKFYKELIALRTSNPALSQGSLQWLPNSIPQHVLTYMRSDNKSQFLIEINLLNAPEAGTINSNLGSGWKEVVLSGEGSWHVDVNLPNFSLGAKDFAIFHRSVAILSTGTQKPPVALGTIHIAFGPPILGSHSTR